jgi:hypothetical protein
MTTRRWMIVVAVIGSLMGGIVITQRRRVYLPSQSQYHAERLERLRGPRVIRTNISFSRLTRERKMLLYHDAMARKYKLAAGHPWLPVEPDPPEPEP